MKRCRRSHGSCQATVGRDRHGAQDTLGRAGVNVQRRARFRYPAACRQERVLLDVTSVDRCRLFPCRIRPRPGGAPNGQDRVPAAIGSRVREPARARTTWSSRARNAEFPYRGARVSGASPGSSWAPHVQQNRALAANGSKEHRPGGPGRRFRLIVDEALEREVRQDEIPYALCFGVDKARAPMNERVGNGRHAEHVSLVAFA